MTLAKSDFGALNLAIQKEIYQEFYKLVYSSIMYTVRDHASTEDIIQEAFLKVVNRIPTFDNDSRLKAWIKVVVKNTLYDFIRKNKKNRNEVDTESVYIYDNVNYSTGQNTPEHEIELKMMSEAIKKCLHDLKPEYQVIIELRWKRELSYKEIANALESSEEKVKSKLHRAREAIKKKFASEWGE